MPQYPIELILLRQLASYLATPMFIVDGEGTLIFFNEAAEVLLGRRFADTNEMARDEWLAAFAPRAINGRSLSGTDNPLLHALAHRREYHTDVTIRGLDGVDRHIEATGMPLLGVSGRLLGAVAIFWPRP